MRQMYFVLRLTIQYFCALFVAALNLIYDARPPTLQPNEKKIEHERSIGLRKLGRKYYGNLKPR